MATVELSLKLVADFTTRRQTGLNQIANWTSGIEAWSLSEVDDLVASSPVGLTLDATEYDLEIIDYGSFNGDRSWEIYPMRNVTLTVDAGDEAAARAHFDTYFDDLRVEIETFIDSNSVTHRATVTGWHIHLAAGPLDEVV